jgi:hypothetical protein
MIDFLYFQIPHGKKAGKDLLLKMINENMNVPFVPVSVSRNINLVKFVVNNMSSNKIKIIRFDFKI